MFATNARAGCLGGIRSGIIFLAFFPGTVSVVAADEQNWFLYPELHADFRSDLDPDSKQDASDTTFGLSALYTRDMSGWRLLAEAYATNDGAEIERLKAGWQVSKNTTAWFGQFHNPIGYWNKTFHHGSVTETASHRPGVAEYEDNGGVLPMHLVGLMVEYTRPFVGGRFEYTVALGEGPVLTQENMLEPIHMIEMGEEEHDTSATFGVAITNGSESSSGAITTTGLFISQSVIPSETGLITEINQHIFGGYFHGNYANWDLTWAYYSVTNELIGNASAARHSFGGGYAQIEYDIDRLWIAYLRVEDIQGAEDDPYLALFPDFIADRNLVGLKFNFRDKQSLTFEIHEARLVTGEHLHTSIQWTAEFPR